ncbi:diguanylate cyclase, partial [Staphylococcus aureus]
VAVQAVEVGAGLAPMHLTVSIGLADTQTHGHDLATLLSRADDAMYDAKRGGRNQTVVAAAA